MEDLYKHMIQYEHVRSVNPYKTMTTRHCQTYTYNCTVSQSVTTTDINLMKCMSRVMHLNTVKSEYLLMNLFIVIRTLIFIAEQKFRLVEINASVTT